MVRSRRLALFLLSFTLCGWVLLRGTGAGSGPRRARARPAAPPENEAPRPAAPAAPLGEPRRNG